MSEVIESIYPHCDYCPRNVNNFCLKLQVPLFWDNMLFYGDYNEHPCRCGRYLKVEKVTWLDLIWVIPIAVIGRFLEQAKGLYLWFKREPVRLERFKYDGKRTWLEKVEREKTTV